MAKPARNQKMESYDSTLSDMITNLPESVIESILMKLPTYDAVRTSILSRKWRYKWAELSQFIFDEALWDRLEVKDPVQTFTTVMYQFMSIHRGPVKTFVLSFDILPMCPGIDNLIVFLSWNGIVDLTIEMWQEDYSLHSSIFTCQHLKHLNIRGCKIKTPLAFQGFSKLTSLKLNYCTLSTKALRILISKSPLLEQLELAFNYSIDLCIDAPNLRTFSFVGDTKSIVFKRQPLLASVFIFLPRSKAAPLPKFFQRFPVLETLCLNNHMVQSFAVVEPEDPTPLVHLKHLMLYSMSFDEIVARQFVLYLMRRSPNLRSIKIQFVDNSISMSTKLYLEREDYSDLWMSELKEVKLKYVTGTKPELEFIKMLLAKSPTLKRLRIIPDTYNADNHCKILTEVIKFQRASTEAQVIYKRRREIFLN